MDASERAFTFESRQDWVLFRRAVANRWNIPTDVKQRALDKLQKLIDSQDERTANIAIKTLALLESQNQKDEHAEIEKFRRDLAAAISELATAHGLLDAEDTQHSGEAGIPQRADRDGDVPE